MKGFFEASFDRGTFRTAPAHVQGARLKAGAPRAWYRGYQRPDAGAIVRTACAALLLLAASSLPAHAACNSPPGGAGDQIYNSTHNVMQYCNGNQWIAMGSGGASSDPDTLGSLSCNDGDGIEFDGSQWICKAGGGGGGGGIGGGDMDDCADGDEVLFAWDEDSGAIVPRCVDKVPDAFSFTNATGVPLNVREVSNTVVLSGFDTGVALNVIVSGQGSPEISIQGGEWTTGGTIENGQSLRVRLTAAGSGNVTRTAAIMVGDASVNWSVTTSNNFCAPLGATQLPSGACRFQNKGTFDVALPPGRGMFVQVWGAGGNASNGHSAWTKCYGGGGGYAAGRIPPVASATTVKVFVGENGRGDDGGGGDYSGVFFNSITQGNARVIAGGGGAQRTTNTTCGGTGGGGGGTSGGSLGSATGGTQSAGGNSGGGALTAPTAGGNGYYGGGSSGSGGGGGSGYLHPSVTDGQLNTANNQNSAGSGQPNYVSNRGRGGYSYDYTGGDGLVVITFE